MMQQASTILSVQTQAKPHGEKVSASERDSPYETSFAEALVRQTPNQPSHAESTPGKMTADEKEAAKIAGDDDTSTEAAAESDILHWLTLVEEAQNGDDREVEELEKALTKLSAAGYEEIASVLARLVNQQGKSESAAPTDGVETGLALPQPSELHEALNKLSAVDGEAAAMVLAKLGEQLESLTEKAVGTDGPARETILRQLERLIDVAESGLEQASYAKAGAAEELLKPMLARLTEQLTELLDAEPEKLASLDANEIRAHLEGVLNNLRSEEQTLSAAEKQGVLETLQQQIRALISDAVATEDSSTDVAAEKQVALESLLQKLDSMLTGINENKPRNVLNRSETALTPAMQALAEAAESLREQLKSAPAGTSEHETADMHDGVRRLTAESLAQASAGRVENSHTSSATAIGAPANAQSVTQAAQPNQRLAEAQTVSFQETARQAQQAVDILGPQAPDQLRERISVMFNTRTQAAEVRLDPPDLGRLQVRINLNQEQATVSFQVTTPQAREALEQNMPRLREMLAEQGLNLAEANVSEQSEQNGRQGAGTAERTPGYNNEVTVDAELEEESFIETGVMQNNGRIDYYA